MKAAIYILHSYSILQSVLYSTFLITPFSRLRETVTTIMMVLKITAQKAGFIMVNLPSPIAKTSEEIVDVRTNSSLYTN